MTTSSKKSCPDQDYSTFHLRKVIRTHFGAVTVKVAKQSPVQKLEIRALLPDIWPFRALETTDPGPMIYLEFVHAIKQNIQGNPEKLMANNYIGVGFIQRNYANM
jgi:hypothetical protein